MAVYLKNPLLNLVLSAISCLVIFFPFEKAIGADQAESDIRQAVHQIQSEYVIGLADRLGIQVWREEELSIEVPVRIDGKISLPIIGDIQAAGKTTTELASAIKERLKKVITEPTVSVILLESMSLRYYILGQVQQPGQFAIDHPISVLQAIARSGGFNEWADKDNILIVRQNNNKEIIIRFDYNSFIKGKKRTKNILIAPGDTIVVP